jgi:hypothetical protein
MRLSIETTCAVIFGQVRTGEWGVTLAPTA